jgi:hypothetical protein
MPSTAAAGKSKRWPVRREHGLDAYQETTSSTHASKGDIQAGNISRGTGILEVRKTTSNNSRRPTRIILDEGLSTGIAKGKTVPLKETETEKTREHKMTK